MEPRRHHRSRDLAEDGRGRLPRAPLPEEYGGAGVDFLYDAIIIEELAYMRAHGIMTTVHASICLPYVTFGTEAQKRKFLPPARDRRAYSSGSP